MKPFRFTRGIREVEVLMDEEENGEEDSWVDLPMDEEECIEIYAMTRMNFTDLRENLKAYEARTHKGCGKSHSL